MTTPRIQVLRLNSGEPIISPTSNWWEDGVTFNAAALFLDRLPENELIVRALLPMIPAGDARLANGVVAIHYRARPEYDPASSFGRSFIGLALFTPGLDLLYRYTEPVLWPSPNPAGFDALGVEDPRITRMEGRFYMVYAGVRADPQTDYKVALCLAVSDDLLYWEKLGPLTGEINDTNNKDGVLFPGKLNGQFALLHRPYQDTQNPNERAIRLALSDTPLGPWTDRGEVLRALPDPRFETSWPGAGSVPISLGNDRWLMIYHTGHFAANGMREYDLDAAILDLTEVADHGPRLVSRLEHFMTPETPAELRSHSRLQVENVLFACGSYEIDGHIDIIYGGADTYTLAARVDRADLLAALDKSGTA